MLKLPGTGLSVMAALLRANHRENVATQAEVVKRRRRLSSKDRAVICVFLSVCVNECVCSELALNTEHSAGSKGFPGSGTACVPAHVSLDICVCR